MVGTFLNLLDPLNLIVVPLVLKYITKDWFPIHFVYFILSTISGIIALFLPESPKFLISKGRFTEAKVSFNIIARYNGKEGLKSNDHFEEELISKD